jgi:peptidoglycan hydrolase-like protein with peptidoglycan-binding domain
VTEHDTTDPTTIALLDLPPMDLQIVEVIPPDPGEWAGACLAEGFDALGTGVSDDEDEQVQRVMSLLAAAAPRTSQNGWPASSDRDAIGIRTFKVPGAAHVLVPLRADVAPLLLAFAAWWHTTVEPLVVPGCWGYAYRVIRGATALSNHASGTAIDLNAPKHPLGAVGTVPDRLRASIERKAAALGLRWGGSYSGRKDEMHAEVVVSHTRAMQLVAALQAAPTPKPKPAPAPTPKPGARPTLRRGSTGDAVREVQRVVKVAVDGVFGQRTEAAVKSFQGSRGLVPDGIVGPKTWAALLAKPKPAPKPTKRPTIRRGAKGDHVRALQARLNRDYPSYSNLAVDGDFGPRTERVVREFQQRHPQLAVDGVVGPKTWAALAL